MRNERSMSILRYLLTYGLAGTALTICCFPTNLSAGEEGRLLRRPTVSRTEVAFAYAGDLWVVSRNDGQSRRLTFTPTIETDPHFSPDGSQIAFSATRGGNSDVYVMPSAGGTQKRLTYHPGVDYVRGWTRDGKKIIFTSSRGASPVPRNPSYTRLWNIDVAGGMPERLPMPRAYDGVFSPDGKQIAYEEIQFEFETLEGQTQRSQWRHYRGGRTHPIRIMNLENYAEQELPWRNSIDSDPMWIGRNIYFLSDRDFVVNLFAYDTKSKKLNKLTRHDDYDIMNASAGADAIVYEQAGNIHLFDIKTGHTRKLEVEVSGEFPWADTQEKNVSGMVSNVVLSPDGTQFAIEARGEIFLKPRFGGIAVDLTKSSGAHDRNPAWSPNGSSLAWLSDASGEYQLFLMDRDQKKNIRKIELPDKSFFSTPVWSPDSAHLLLRDNHLRLWMIDLENGHATLIDKDKYFDEGERQVDGVWSPDSRWIAYSKGLENHLRAIFLYSVEERRAYQVTGSLVDSISPAFDAGGRYLYFLTSVDYGPNTAEWINLSALDKPVSRTVYCAVLDKNGPAPFLPGSSPDQSTPPDPGISTAELKIDIDGIGERILPLNIPAGDYIDLQTGTPGTLFYRERAQIFYRLRSQTSPKLYRHQLQTRMVKPILDGAVTYELSADKKWLLYHMESENKWAMLSTEQPEKTATAIDLSTLSATINLRAEWANIFRETWRNQRDFFYQATMHGADWQTIYDKYLPLLPYVNHRDDLGYLIATVGGELTVGHSSLDDEGDLPHDEPVTTGMLGANYVVEQDHYRISHIYGGDPWNPDLRAPLHVPGLNVKEGDFLLAVNGVPLLPPTNLYSFFTGTADKPSEIRVNTKPTLNGSYSVTVIPIANDEPLRNYEDWIEKNRKRVDKLSGGRLAYVWLSNTAPPGYRTFNREYYSQQNKDGAIIDVRYNQGGLIADNIVLELIKPQIGYFGGRDGESHKIPTAGIYGPKVMIINESSGSGGDALPYYFRKAGAGPLVGTRTWGGLVGVAGEIPKTIDGGGISVPDSGFFDFDRHWSIENEGISPDIEVNNKATAVIAGEDPQLERAVKVALKLLKQNPPPNVSPPAPVDRVTGTSL